MERIGKMKKRRHRITSLRAALGDEGVADHESRDWNRGLMNSRKERRLDFDEDGEDDRSFAPPVNRTVDELVIGVSVPRKARSATIKRLNTNWSFRNAGFGGGLSQHRSFLPLKVAVGRRGSRGSPPNGGLRKNMRSVGLTPELPKAVGDSSLVQDDEIEVVEALFDLMNQTHSELDRSKKKETVPVSTSGSHKESVTNKKCIKNSHLPGKSGFFGRNDGFVKKGMGISVLNDDLIAEDDNNLAWSKDPAMQSENLLPQSTGDVSVGKKKGFNKRGEALFTNLKRISSKKRVVAPQDEEFPLHANQNSNKQVDSILLEGNPAADIIDTKREAKFQTGSMRKIADEVVEKEQEESKVQPSYSRQGSSKLEHLASNCSGRSELVKGGEEQNQCKPLIPGHKFALPTSLPFPNSGAGWARCTQYTRFMNPFQVLMPDRNVNSLAALPVFTQHPPFLVSQPRRKRCATHQYIAHNILYHQKLMMNLKTLPATAVPASIYKAPMPDALIATLVKTDGDEFKGECMGKTMLSALGGYKTFDAGNNMNVSSNKQLMVQQITTPNVLGSALVVQLGQQQTLMVPPTNQNDATLVSNFVKGALGTSSSSPVVSADHVNHLSKIVPPHMTIFPNNGNPSPFSNTNSMSYVGGSYYSSPSFNVSQTQPQQS